ncbi:hypothetical protein [Niveispirillum sp. BGYR6]|uniref:hypothetical protein n=1 Tax=Niveispirillum sp. BGYR6 TaxID=2971249 RepID=UPI0022B991D7|nr:hypothetical protein [Niveispirillum sp. BGYR6]MDG5496326.1 hypothetical protein [Niveispirillum sp. BGYR6]
MKKRTACLLACLPAVALLAPVAWAAVPVELRETAAGTELLIASGDRRPVRFQRGQCHVVLGFALEEEMDLGAVARGAGHIKGVGLLDPHTLTVATECGSRIGYRREGDHSILTIAAPLLPGQKPTPPEKPEKQQAKAGKAEKADKAEKKAAAAVPAPLTEGAPAPAAPQPLAPHHAARDAEFARSAIAEGLKEAAKPPAPDPAEKAAALMAPRPSQTEWGTEGPLLDLAAWRRQPFRAERDRLRQAEAAGEAVAPTARRDMLRFLLAWGLASEVRAAINPQGMTDDEQPLLAVAAALADPRDAAADFLLTPAALRAADGPLWAATLLRRRGEMADALHYLPLANRALPSLPADLARPVGLDLLSLATGRGLDGMAREIARTVEATKPQGADLARLYYEIGRLHAANKRAALALTQWDKAADLPGPHAALAAMAATELRLGNGASDAASLEQVLKRAVRDWPGAEVEMQALRRLATLAGEAGRVAEGLEWLRLLRLRFPDRTPAERVADDDLAGRLLLALTGTDFASQPLPERVALYERNRDLIPDGPAGWAVRRHHAGNLADAGMTTGAEQELSALLALVPAEEKLPIRLDMARLQLAGGDAGATLATLDELGDKLGKQAPQAALLRAQALLLTGDLNGALEQVADQGDAASLRARASALWRQQRWADVARTLQALEKRDSLSGEEATKLALSGILSGDRDLASRTLERHGAQLGKRPWLAGLTTLAKPVPGEEAGDADLRALVEDARVLGGIVRR